MPRKGRYKRKLSPEAYIHHKTMHTRWKTEKNLFSTLPTENMRSNWQPSRSVKNLKHEGDSDKLKDGFKIMDQEE